MLSVSGLRFFGKDASQNPGYKIMLAGMAAILVGIGLVYFSTGDGAGRWHLD